MATMKKAQAGIKKAASKMVLGEMTGKMYKKSAIDAIGAVSYTHLTLPTKRIV